MKHLILLFAFFFIKQTIFSQWTKNEDPLTLKELHLTNLQKKKIKKINNNSKIQINVLKNDNGSDENLPTKIDKITGARIKEIRNCLTPEQQTAWRKILMSNKPRRGVTDLPNERTVQ